jgi:cytochrome P450
MTTQEMPAQDVAETPIEQLAATFHVFDPAHAQWPSPIMNRLLNECPVAKSQVFEGGYYVVTKVEHARRILTDPETFSSSAPIVPRLEGSEMLRSIPLTLDPPEHTAYRRLLGLVFTPSRIERLEPEVRELARSLATKLVAGGGTVDFMKDFAIPYPAGTLLKVLGLPIEDLETLLHFTDLMTVNQFSPDEAVREDFKNVQIPKIRDYVVGQADLRRDPDTAPEGLFTALVHTQLRNERPLTDDELVGIVTLLISAGLDTTTSHLCMHFAYLAEHQDRWRELIEHPERIPGAVDELLRYNSNVNPARLIMKDTEVGGVAMKAGEMVSVVLPATAFDPDEFPDPMTIDFERKPNRHLTFGGGPHTCLGNHLARFLLRIGMQELIEAMPAFRIAPGTTPVRHAGILMGMDNLKLEI